MRSSKDKKTVAQGDFSGGFQSNRKKTRIGESGGVESSALIGKTPVMAGFLVSFSREESGEFWVLREGNNPLGKSAENQIILQDERVSDKHANINVSKNKSTDSWVFQLVDLSSSNGTELNGDRLPIYSGVTLNDQDKIKVGGFTFLLVSADKFAHRLTTDSALKEDRSISYDSRDYFSSEKEDKATRAGD